MGNLMNTKNEVFNLTLANLQKELSKKTSTLFPLEDMPTPMQILEDRAVGRLKTDHQFLMNDMLEKLEVLMKMGVLYVTQKDGVYRAAAFSYPYENEMYILYMTSHQRGLTDEITFVIYSSMEDIYQQVLKERNSMEDGLDGTIIRVADYADIIRFYR